MSHKFTGTKGVIIDLNGTLVDLFDDRHVEGSFEALELLRNSSLKCQFVANNSKENITTTQRRLCRLGFEISCDEIFNSLTAARYFIQEKDCRPYLLIPEDAKQQFCGMDCSDPNCVVVGIPPANLHYCDLNYAYQLLMSGADLIATSKAKTYKTRGSLSMAAGGIVAALEYSANMESLVVGKPSEYFYQAAAGSMRVCEKKSVVIGDDYREDIIPAIDAGMKAILVKTGKYQTSDEFRVNRPEHLFHVAANVEAAMELLV